MYGCLIISLQHFGRLERQKQRRCWSAGCAEDERGGVGGGVGYLLPHA